MFENIKSKWREARGKELRLEFEDAVFRLNALGPDVNSRASVYLAAALEKLEADFGSLANISDDGKYRLAKEFRKAAKQRVTFDIGYGFGLALLSIYLESQAIPGEDSLHVRAAIEHILGVLQIKHVEEYLRIMGYDILPYGAIVAAYSLMSEYNEVETASHIAVTTMARDVREAGMDIFNLIDFRTHGMALLEVLKSYKSQGRMRESIWENHAAAVLAITTPDHRHEWIDAILSDPVSGKERLAKSRISLKKRTAVSP